MIIASTKKGHLKDPKQEKSFIESPSKFLFKLLGTTHRTCILLLINNTLSVLLPSTDLHSHTKASQVKRNNEEKRQTVAIDYGYWFNFQDPIRGSSNPSNQWYGYRQYPQENFTGLLTCKQKESTSTQISKEEWHSRSKKLSISGRGFW